MKIDPTRREWLRGLLGGIGSLSLAGLAKCGLHLPARAKSVIFLYMEGGPSQIDTFDPKPELTRRHGENAPFDTPATVFNVGKKLFGSPFSFSKHGDCGASVSELFPHVATCVDDLTIIRSLHHESSNHSAACYLTHTGYPIAGSPSMGSWITYALGSESKNLPEFVVLDCGQAPSGGAYTWGNGYLPVRYQGTKFLKGEVTVEFLNRREKSNRLQDAKLSAIRQLNKRHAERTRGDSRIEAILASYEKAASMQLAVPELTSLSGESKATKEVYGMGDGNTEVFGSRCLLARRLVERGVRFVEVLSPRVKADRWDQHGDLERGHRENASKVDKPIAGLLRDLKARGLLDETIVVWGGEFGRTPMSQGKNGRDHNPYGYTVWVAGGGFRPGIRYGKTDDFGYYASEQKVHLHDFHATLLHQFGIDHKKLTYRHAGRDFRLTDVHGNVVREIIDT
jgi:hypothetical protein